MLQLINLSLAFGEQVLFRNLNWHIRQGDRVGVVGPNAAGKTTLFRLLTGQIEPDVGVVQRGRDLSIGYLPQEGIPQHETASEISFKVQATDLIIHALILPGTLDPLRSQPTRAPNPAPEGDWRNNRMPLFWFLPYLWRAALDPGPEPLAESEVQLGYTFFG